MPTEDYRIKRAREILAELAEPAAMPPTLAGLAQLNGKALYALEGLLNYADEHLRLAGSGTLTSTTTALNAAGFKFQHLESQVKGAFATATAMLDKVRELLEQLAEPAK